MARCLSVYVPEFKTFFVLLFTSFNLIYCKVECFMAFTMKPPVSIIFQSYQRKVHLTLLKET